MSITNETAITELGKGSLADPSSHLKPKGRDEVAAEISRWESRGLRAHVLVVDPGDSLSDLLKIWDRLGYDPSRDLLLVFDTRAMAARGWGLSDQQLVDALVLAAPRPHEVFAERLIEALGALGRAKLPTAPASPASQPDTGSSFALPIVGGVVGLGAVGVIALAIARRNRLAKEGLASVGEASKSAERAYTDLILACEELQSDPKASEIQLKASELKKRVDTIVADTEAKPERGTDPVTIGKIRQLENEMAALRSTVLQKERG
jgi:hypothetical protein